MRRQLLVLMGLLPLIFVAAAATFVALWPALRTFDQSRLRGALTLSSADELALKVDYVDALPGTRIALLGDSFVFGGAMADIVSGDWRVHTLDRYLESCLRERTGQPVSVINFGQDGFLPLDMAAVVSRLQARGVEYFVMNLNSRSMSNDFNVPSARYSRPWMREAAGSGLISATYAKLSLYRRMRFNETPADWGKRHARAIERVFVGSERQTSTMATDFRTLLKLKARYRTATFDPERSVQARALLDLLSDAHVYAFATVENTSLGVAIMSVAKRNQLASEMTSLVAAAGAGQRMLPSPANLTDEDFVDYLHVTPSGSRKYAETLCAALVSRPLAVH